MPKYYRAGQIHAAIRYRDVKQLSTDLERSKNSLMLAFQILAFQTQVRIMGATQDISTQYLLWQLRQSEELAQIRSELAVLRDQRKAIPPASKLPKTDDDERHSY